jgi:hypothetical protein
MTTSSPAYNATLQAQVVAARAIAPIAPIAPACVSPAASWSLLDFDRTTKGHMLSPRSLVTPP